MKIVRAFLVHGSNAALIALCAAYAMAVGLGALPFRPLLVGLGAALFVTTEYTTHRFLFHARPARGAWLRRQQHRLHYDHHAEPNRLDLLFLPLWYVLPNLAVTGGLALLLLRDPGAVAALLTGAMLALLHYEWVHFIAHIPYRPVTPWGRWMKKYHLRHHFQNERLWFGVSNPLTDLLAGTYADHTAVARSKTTRNLFG